MLVVALSLVQVPDALVAIRVQPRASRDRVLGERDGAIAIALKAPPVDGEANAALIKFIARCLSLPPRQVQLVRGHSSRQKWIRVEGIAAAAVRDQLLGSSMEAPSST
ncbi:DUF167 domain-containing protein [Vulcanococcus sp.]|uniref:DUF167 domain-containing protein n=1 Tax=Vulcanococcus sp. TaxID=2856995 RepID=UPI0032244F0A